METRPFYYTSEFWITVGAVIASLAGVFPVNGKVGSTLAVVSAAAYAISRGLAKSGTPVLPADLAPDEGDKGSA
jgi:hypothetical protein